MADDKSVIEGHGALYDVRSLDMGFVEVIERGAFDAADISDVRMLNDHNSRQVLARTTSGTLIVTPDEQGLYYRGDVADTSFGRDLLVSVRRKDITQSSFGFIVAENGDDWDFLPDGQLFRRVRKIKTVVDVSPTAFPAYPQTRIDNRALAEIRSMLEKPKTDMERIDLMVKVHRMIYG